MHIFEWILLLALSLLLAAAIARAFLSRERVCFWYPLTIVAAVYAYYFVAGPIVAISNDATMVLREDARSVYYLGWIAGVVGFASTAAGFAIPLGRYGNPRFMLAVPSPTAIRTISWFCLGLGLFGVLASLAGPSRGFDDSFGKYVFSLNNLLAIYFALSIWLYRDEPVRMLSRVLIPFGLLILLLVLVGFRGPILMIAISIASFWYLVRRSRPSIFLSVAVAVSVVILAGAMVLTRSYFEGIDLSRLQGLGLWDVVLGGFGDSVTFGALALVIEKVPAVYPFCYAEPIWVALSFPIPRSLWPGKPIAEYIRTINLCVDPVSGSLDQGMAVPNVGEYYLAFGWAGIVLGSFALGLICRGMWNWYRRSPENPLVIATYGAFFSWLFQVIHRGYLPFAVLTFCFSVLPGIVLAHWFSRRVIRGQRRLTSNMDPRVAGARQ